MAIVGSGPAGFFLADALSKDGEIDVHLFEKLPYPFGLIRYGVAPDHQGTKAVTRVLSRVAKRANVRFFGGVEVGKRVSIEDLLRSYSVVVLATGATVGRKLDFDGANIRPQNTTAFDLVRSINGHPDYAELCLPNQVKSVAVFGGGNVALDCVRLICLPLQTLRTTDASRAFIEWRSKQRVKQVVMVMRGDASSAKFSPDMFSELKRLDGIGLRIEGSPEALSFPHKCNPLSEIFSILSESERENADVDVVLLFGHKPVSFSGRHLRLLDGKGLATGVGADMIVHAVGQTSVPFPGVPFDARDAKIPNRNGWVTGLDRCYTVGWASGSARLAIPDCRSLARHAASEIMGALSQMEPSSMDPSLYEEVESIRHFAWADWERYDSSELELGKRAGACRVKLRSYSPCEELEGMELGNRPSN
ncbi:MAG: FAD-dependent oxidoreductase [Alphaproteobacteria bacterium]